jgi:hypothetical protein
MPFLAARMRVVTAVTVAFVLELPFHVHDGPVKIDVRPSQAERLVLPEAEGEAD